MQQTRQPGDVVRNVALLFTFQEMSERFSKKKNKTKKKQCLIDIESFKISVDTLATETRLC